MSAYSAIYEKVHACATRSGRDPSKILLVAVSKGRSWEEALPAYNLSCRNFGESRVQEALEKMSLAPQDIKWHLIGSLQRNKVNKVIGKFTLIHSVDTYEIAEKIASVKQPTNILLQVNTSGEATKHGLSPREWEYEFEKLLKLSSLRILGLMTIAPFTDDKELIRRCFRALRQFRDKLERNYLVSLPDLSMGMSNDYEIAIEEGATILRIGTAIFS